MVPTFEDMNARLWTGNSLECADWLNIPRLLRIIQTKFWVMIYSDHNYINLLKCIKNISSWMPVCFVVIDVSTMQIDESNFTI